MNMYKHYTKVQGKDGKFYYELSKKAYNKIMNFLKYNEVFTDGDYCEVIGACSCGSTEYIIDRSYKLSGGIPTITVICRSCGSVFNYATDFLIENIDSNQLQYTMAKDTYFAIERLVKESIKRQSISTVARVIKFPKREIKSSISNKKAKLIMFPRRELNYD